MKNCRVLLLLFALFSSNLLFSASPEPLFPPPPASLAPQSPSAVSAKKMSLLVTAWRTTWRAFPIMVIPNFIWPQYSRIFSSIASATYLAHSGLSLALIVKPASHSQENTAILIPDPQSEGGVAFLISLYMMPLISQVVCIFQEPGSPSISNASAIALGVYGLVNFCVFFSAWVAERNEAQGERLRATPQTRSPNEDQFPVSLNEVGGAQPA